MPFLARHQNCWGKCRAPGCPATPPSFHWKWGQHLMHAAGVSNDEVQGPQVYNVLFGTSTPSKQPQGAGYEIELPHLCASL